MYLTLLRHEARPMEDPRFFTSLTQEGLNRSKTSLVDRLYVSDPPAPPIDVIYCSPFLRTVQTVIPFAQATGLKIRIEPALYEFMENPLFTDDNWYHTVDELPSELQVYIDTTYKPIFPLSRLKFRETWDDCLIRTTTFLDYLISPQCESPISLFKHPLLVSHMTTINSCLYRWDTSVVAESTFPIGGTKLIKIVSPIEATKLK